MEAGVADVTLGRIPLYRQSNVNAGGAYDSRWTAPEMRRNCFLVIGNHERYGGIGDVLFTLATYFSRHFNVLVSESLVPNEINVLIDEFSQRTFVDNVRRTRVEYPNTRFILMATEFVTEMSIFGCSFGNTFNYFDIRDNFRQWLELIGGKTTDEHIARILASGPRRGTELVRLTGKSKEHVALVLARMRLNGQVIRISRGVYGLDCQKTL